MESAHEGDEQKEGDKRYGDFRHLLSDESKSIRSPILYNKQP